MHIEEHDEGFVVELLDIVCDMFQKTLLPFIDHTYLEGKKSRVFVCEKKIISKNTFTLY